MLFFSGFRVIMHTRDRIHPGQLRECEGHSVWSRESVCALLQQAGGTDAGVWLASENPYGTHLLQQLSPYRPTLQRLAGPWRLPEQIGRRHLHRPGNVLHICHIQRHSALHQWDQGAKCEGRSAHDWRHRPSAESWHHDGGLWGQRPQH